MKTHFYSTQPFIAWVINHYFYGKTHYTFVAPFYPYRQLNPKSSNPYLIYSDLLMPWKDNDIYDKTVAQFRINIRKGVMIKETLSHIDPSLANELRELCDKISLKFFYPIVYRVDIDSIAEKVTKTASAFTGSNEYLIQQLFENEFDILFFDEWREFLTIKDLYEGKDKLNPEEVLAILKENYVDTI